MWYVYWSMLNFSSVNRFVQICYPDLLWLFSRTKVIIACVIVWPLCALLATTSSFFLPCCETIASYQTYSYNYIAIGDTFNFTKWGVDLPTNIICSSTAIFCYSMIIRHVYQQRKKIANSLSDRALLRRVKQEFGFAQQFIAISFAFALTWLLFIFYPKVIPEHEPKWFALSAVGVVINSTINGLVYIRFNEKLSSELRQLVCFKRAHDTQAASTAIIQQSAIVHTSARSGSNATPAEDITMFIKPSENDVARIPDHS